MMMMMLMMMTIHCRPCCNLLIQAAPKNAFDCSCRYVVAGMSLLRRFGPAPRFTQRSPVDDASGGGDRRRPGTPPCSVYGPAWPEVLQRDVFLQRGGAATACLGARRGNRRRSSCRCVPPSPAAGARSCCCRRRYIGVWNYGGRERPRSSHRVAFLIPLSHLCDSNRRFSAAHTTAENRKYAPKTATEQYWHRVWRGSIFFGWPGPIQSINSRC